MTEPNFAELIDRARQREPEATRLLIERYESAIRRQVRHSLLGNRLRRVLDETDVCQSVMGKFFVGLCADRFDLDGPEQLIALLKEMVRNKIVSKARHWKARRRDYQRTIGQPDAATCVEPVSPGPTPSQIIADAELLAEFERRLSDQEREILALRRQGMSWTAVSDGIDGGGAEATRKRFDRALDRVGREFGLRDE